jgi:hypothetical protein
MAYVLSKNDIASLEEARRDASIEYCAWLVEAVLMYFM